MKLKQVLKLAVASAAATMFASSASAALVVVDAWKIVTPWGGTTSNIGHLNATNQTTSVIEQEVNGFFQPFVGAKFHETGATTTLSYTINDRVGINDSGGVGLFSGLEAFTYTFGAVTGSITSIVGSQINYKFDAAPNGTVSMAGGAIIPGPGVLPYWTGSANGIGGATGVGGIVGGSQGTSTLITTVDAVSNSFQILAQDGTDLTSALLAGKYVFQAVTTNTIGSNITSGACSWDASKNCLRFNATTDGQIYLMRVIPAPGTLALVGLSLVGLAVASRRRRQQ